MTFLYLGRCAAGAAGFQRFARRLQNGLAPAALGKVRPAAAFAAKPHIRLTVTETLRQVTLTVNNNGATIPTAIRGKLFEPGITTKGENHGMGLAIVRRTLEQYGGTISVDAKPHDTTFTIVVPRSVAA